MYYNGVAAPVEGATEGYLSQWDDIAGPENPFSSVKITGCDGVPGCWVPHCDKSVLLRMRNGKTIMVSDPHAPFSIPGANQNAQLTNLVDLDYTYRYMSGRGVLLEDEIPATVIDRLIALGHLRATPPGVLRSSMGGGQAIMIDPVNGTLMGGVRSTQMDWLSVID